MNTENFNEDIKIKKKQNGLVSAQMRPLLQLGGRAGHTDRHFHHPSIPC